MATRIESSRNLIGTQSISFIRPITLTLSLNGIKPSTLLYVYFDKKEVSYYCDGYPLYSDSNGNRTITLRIPGGTFTTGVKEIIVSDSYIYEAIDQIGSVFGSAKASFTSTGVIEIYQTTQTTVNTETVVIEKIVYEEPVPVRDPLAQQFFTYGVTDGMFITSIGLYFQTKDEFLPVRVELREMVNGYPSQLSKNEFDLIASLNPNQIATSNNASAETKFTFPVPVYLEENKDYCFVVFSNSNKYTIFTQKIGERSIENGKVIYTQPYVGSLFKSENNITWSVEQTEDIKFKIYKAEFNTNVSGSLNMNISAQEYAVSGNNFTTTSGSTEVVVKLPQQHGLEVDSYLTIVGQTNGVYNGISNTNFSGNRRVESVIDEYTLKFNAGSIASSDGIVENSGQLTKIEVLAGGSGYETGCLIKIGQLTVGQCVIQNGVIVDAKITNNNITPSLTSEPTLTVVKSDGSQTVGTGVSLLGIVDAMFSVTANKPVNFLYGNIANYVYGSSKIVPTIRSTKLNYDGGNLQTYQLTEEKEINKSGKIDLLDNSLLAQSYNTTSKMSGIPSMLLRYSLFSSNKNISPVIDLRQQASITAYSYKLRNQKGEDVISQNPSGSIDAVELLANGSGYTVAPTITFTGGGQSDQATATATLGTSSISNVDVTSAGSGYITAPTVVFNNTGTGGSGAAATAILSTTGVATATVQTNGFGYEPSTGSLPLVTFVGGGGGSGATAEIVFEPTTLQNIFNVTSAGSGYTTAPIITFTGGGATTQATATATISGGEVISITLNTAGVGYTSVPDLVFDNTGTGGTGAVATCKLVATGIDTLSIVTAGSGYTTAPTFTVTGVGGSGATGTTTLQPRTVNSISVTNVGANYVIAPSVSFNNTGTGGTGAAATAFITGKSIQSINLIYAGSGYTFLPDISIERNAVEIGVDAIALPKLTSINTEIGATGGSNLSRYLSKKISLQEVSDGITLYSEIYSETESNVDWYVRTSLSSTETHNTLTWKKLQCDVERNKSEKKDDFRDYKFYLYDLLPFDTYDLKCILRQTNPAKAPIVNNYRVIIST